MVTHQWVCLNCNKQCERPPARGQRPKYCSIQCGHEHRATQRTCKMCGNGGVRIDAEYCSRLCHQTYLNPHCDIPASHPSRQPTRMQLALAKLATAQAGLTNQSKVWAAIHCKACGTAFITTWWGERSTARCCSPQCDTIDRYNLKSAAKHKRRAIQKQAYVANVNRTDIYKRDRYTCHLCGKKVNRTAAVPHPHAATIDHIIPLAAGGTHEPANCATAHFRCNALKGARGGGEQLALIG